MIALGLILVVGIGLAVGFQFFRVNASMYESFALSYAEQASKNIRGEDVLRYMETGKTDYRYEETRKMLAKSAASANIRSFYVVVPEEEELVYIWDVKGTANSEDKSVPAGFLERRDYLRNEKQPVLDIYSGKNTAVFFVNSRDHRLLGTCVYPVRDENRNPVAVIGVDLSLKEIFRGIYHLLWNLVLSVFILLLAGLLIIFAVFRKKIITPISRLEKATVDIVDNLSSGKEFVNDIHPGNEIEELAESFEVMDRALKQYVRENETITTEAEHIRTEMDLAARIQEAMVPREFPRHQEVDIYASMKAAKEVGGDFYDFYLIDEAHLGLVVADVSGRGIPAALFMMASKIMLKNYAMTGMSPGEVLKTVNHQICTSSKGRMCVSVWFGILDLRDGSLISSRAGHANIARKEPGGLYQQLEGFSGPEIGETDDLCFLEYRSCLKPGTGLFFYSEGLKKTESPGGLEFGTERLLRLLNEAPDESPEHIIGNVTEAAERFRGDRPQADDMTLLSLVYNGAKKVEAGIIMKEMTTEASVENLEKVIAFVDEQLEECGCSMKQQMQLDVAVEELFVNVAYYAYAPGKGDVVIRTEAAEDPLCVSVTFTDSGRPFNPLEKEDPDTTVPMAERQIGGLGIFMAKKNVDEMLYEYRDGKNILTIRKMLA